MGWGRERNILLRVWKPHFSRRIFKTFKGKPKRESSKKTILASSGLELLQMVSEPTRRLSPERGRHETVCQQERWASKGVD